MPDIRNIAVRVLDELEDTQPRMIRAGIRGRVAATQPLNGDTYVLRRQCNSVAMEHWRRPRVGSPTCVELGALPPDLTPRAQALLDSIP